MTLLLKFAKSSVRSQSYANSSWVRVCWLDGATKKDVEAIVSSGGILSSNDHSVSFNRGYSKQVYQAAVNEMSTWPDWESVDFSKVEYWVNDDGSCYLQGGVRRVKNGRCFYLANEVYRLLLLEVSFYPAGDDVPCAEDDDDISLNLVLNQGVEESAPLLCPSIVSRSNHRHNHHAVRSGHLLDGRRRKNKEQSMIYKDLDRQVIYVKELFFREANMGSATHSSALEQMLDYGYCDQDLRFLCRNNYIDHTTYIKAFQSFYEKP